MSCQIADNLRVDWYKVAYQLTDKSSEEDKLAAMKQRETPEYQEAKDALIDHISLCHECRKSQDPKLMAVADRWIKNFHAPKGEEFPKVELPQETMPEEKPWLKRIKLDKAVDYTDY